MITHNIGRILVLGSEGQIGKPLSEYLERNGINVYGIDLAISQKHDLRQKCEMLDYWLPEVDAVVFLAYDIGGSKFLKTRQDDFRFLQNNTQIMSNVFEALQQHKKPFIFASSVMAKMDWSPYGDLKRLGEHFTKSLGGITTRFWNIYGPEHDEEKSHVITDFIKKAKETGKIDMLTDGTEVRQFLYVDDCSDAVLSLLKNYKEASNYGVFDVTNFIWTDIYSVAKIVAEHYGAEIYRPEIKDTVQMGSRIVPGRDPIEKFWNPERAVDIKTGVIKMIEYYEGHYDKG